MIPGALVGVEGGLGRKDFLWGNTDLTWESKGFGIGQRGPWQEGLGRGN